MKAAGIDWEKGKSHWAFQPVLNPTLPAVRNTSWPHDDLDRFILSRIEAANLQPARDADRFALIRRVSLDLNERDGEQFRLDRIDDQMDTIGRSMMGLTLGCARCHDHKFDPIAQTDYYAMAGIFASTKTLSGQQNRQGGNKEYYQPSLLTRLDASPPAEAGESKPVDAGINTANRADAARIAKLKRRLQQLQKTRKKADLSKQDRVKLRQEYAEIRQHLGDLGESVAPPAGKKNKENVETAEETVDPNAILAMGVAGMFCKLLRRWNSWQFAQCIMNRIRAMQNGNILPAADLARHRQGRGRRVWLNFCVAIATFVAGGDAEPAAADEGRAVARRLNRLEYQNTICDLLGVKLDFQEMLPQDSSENGFDNAGQALHTSSFLMERYLEAASIALDRAIANLPQPPVIQKRYSLKETHQVKSTTENVFRQSADDDRVVMFSSSPWQSATLSPFYPPDAGNYRFRISAAGLQSSGKPVTYRVDAGLMLMTGKQHLVSYFDALADESTVVEFVDYLDARNTIRILPYGLASAQEVDKVGADQFDGPGLAIDWIEVEGPLNEGWPPASHHLIFGDLSQKSAPTESQPTRVEVVSSDPQVDAEHLLRRFCRRAFRRTVSDRDIAPFVQLVNGKLNEGRSFEQAMRVGLTAVMVSPPFLFLAGETRHARRLRSRQSAVVFSVAYDAG